jgi:hypothetical protein
MPKAADISQCNWISVNNSDPTHRVEVIDIGQEFSRQRVHIRVLREQEQQQEEVLLITSH